MKRYFGRTLLILCLLAGVGGMTAKAQIGGGVTVEADIPYSFVVRDTTLPAGKYTIKVLDDTDLHVLEIRTASGHTPVLFETESAQADRTPRQTELVFDKLGDQYFLSQIWLSGSNTGAQVEKSKMEQRLEANGMNSERHSVAAHHRWLKRANKAKTTSKSE
jgi:hypothetical protein